MLAHRRWESLDEADVGWPHEKYDFSVSTNSNHERSALGPLVVLNNDEMAAGGDLPMYRHRG